MKNNKIFSSMFTSFSKTFAVWYKCFFTSTIYSLKTTVAAIRLSGKLLFGFPTTTFSEIPKVCLALCRTEYLGKMDSHNIHPLPFRRIFMHSINMMCAFHKATDYRENLTRLVQYNVIALLK